MEEKLIDLVRNYPLLYDSSCKDYTNHEARRNSWEEIGDELGLPGSVCKERWTKLRNAYTNALRRRKSKGESIIPSKWKKMSFLGLSDDQQSMDESDEEVYKTDENSLIDPSGDIPVLQVDTDNPLSITIKESIDSPNSQQNIIPNIRKPKKRRIVESTMNEMLKIMKQSNRKESRHISLNSDQYNGNDETEMLFLSLAKTVKKLSPEEQARAKMEVSNAVFQAEFRHAQCPKPEPYDY